MRFGNGKVRFLQKKIVLFVARQNKTSMFAKHQHWHVRQQKASREKQKKKEREQSCRIIHETGPSHKSTKSFTRTDALESLHSV